VPRVRGLKIRCGRTASEGGPYMRDPRGTQEAAGCRRYTELLRSGESRR